MELCEVHEDVQVDEEAEPVTVSTLEGGDEAVPPSSGMPDSQGSSAGDSLSQQSTSSHVSSDYSPSKDPNVETPPEEVFEKR